MKFDVMVIGGGLSGFTEAMDALRAGKTCALISQGRSLDKIDYNSFVTAGGFLLMGDSAERAEFSEDGVKAIRTRNLGGDSLEADLYVLATGRFFSKGLMADMHSVRETVMNLDLDFDADREKWFEEDFFADQPFMSKGVITDEEGHPYKNGKKVNNVKVVGSILSKTGKQCRKKA